MEWCTAIAGYVSAVSEDGERQDVYERLVLPEIPMLLRVAISMTGQPADAHDLVQDTLLRAWRSLDSFDGRYPRAWRNADHNRYRKAVPTPVEIQPSTPSPRGSDDRSAEETALTNEFDADLATALDELNEDARTLVLLVDADGLSYSEASAYLGIPEGTVMSRLHRARKRTKSSIEQQRKAREVRP